MHGLARSFRALAGLSSSYVENSMRYEPKAKHDLSDVDDKAAGFKVIAVFGYEYLAQVLREMEMPEPEV